MPPVGDSGPKAPYLPLSVAPTESRVSSSQRSIPMRSRLFSLLTLLALAWGSPAPAQDMGTLNPKPPPPLANPADPKLPAKEVFGRALTPIEAQARSIGYYWRGCLAGAKALPVDGESWQVVRLSRNRMWGNPAMIAFLERFSR